MTKTGLYLQDPKYQVRLGGKADFIRDPSLGLYVPLYKLDGASFMSKDAYGHLCTVTGALWTPRARDFDGVDDKIVIPHHESLTFTTGDFTIEAWGKVDVLDVWQTIFSKGHYKIDGYAFYFTSSNAVQLEINQADSSWNASSLAGSLTSGVWYHLLGTRKGTVGKVYINGGEAGSGTLADPLTNTRNPSIGIRAIGFGYLFNGLIGEVRVYNRALTPPEIQHNYLATKWRYR